MVEIVERDALFDDTQKYRYALKRVFSDGSGVCVFIMLNPSTADALKDDPTVRRCIGFTHRWGYKVLHVVNIFALRSTDPKVLYSSDDPVGSQNDRIILELCGAADRIVAAWGTHGRHKARGRKVLRMLGEHYPVKEIMSLGITQEGFPKHPLYVANATKLMPIHEHAV